MKNGRQDRIAETLTEKIRKDMEVLAGKLDAML